MLRAPACDAWGSAQLPQAPEVQDGGLQQPGTHGQQAPPCTAAAGHHHAGGTRSKQHARPLRQRGQPWGRRVAERKRCCALQLFRRRCRVRRVVWLERQGAGCCCALARLCVVRPGAGGVGGWAESPRTARVYVYRLVRAIRRLLLVCGRSPLWRMTARQVSTTQSPALLPPHANVLHACICCCGQQRCRGRTAA